MASDNELQIIFGADTAPLRSEVKKATGIVDQFGNEVNSVANTASKGFEKVRQSFQKVPRVVNDLGSATKGLKTNSNSAALALNDLSRVAQDVPFGFIGIQNNINPLLESFRRLKAETGSTGGALKALAGSLTGAGGLGLAVGIVTAAFTIYQNGISGFNRKTRDATDAFDEFKKSLKDSATISSDATASVQGEILKVRTLAGVITDVNQSTAERKRALAELQQVNKSYFGDLTLEAAALGKLTTATEDYTKALIQQAIAKGFADEISKVSAELFKQERILKGLAKDYTVLNDQIEGVKDQKAIGQGAPAAAALARGVENASEKLNDQVKVVGDLRGTLSELSTGYKNALTQGLQFKDLDSTKSSKKETDALKQRIAALKEIVELERRSLKPEDVFVSDASIELKNLEIKLIRRDGKSQGFTQQEIDDIIRQRFPEFETGLKFSKPIEVQAEFTFKPIGSDIISSATQQGMDAVFKKIVIDPANRAGEKARAELAKPFDNLKASINGIVVDTFSNLGDAIGDVLSGANPFQAFISVIADALQQLGKALIVYGVAEKVAIDALTKKPDPFLAIAGGIAAIAAGKLLKNQLGKQRKFADGGLVMGPTMGMIGEAGPEMVIPLNRANQFLDSNSNIDITGDLRLRGTDLVLAVNRASSQRNRF